MLAPLAILLLGLLTSTHARPRPLDQTIFSSPDETGSKEGGWSELARKFAPIIYLAEDERFWPSSTSFILPNLTVLNASSLPFHPQPSPLSRANLDSLPHHGSDLHLGVVTDHDELVRRYNAQNDGQFDDEDDVDVRIFGQPPPKEGEGEWEVVVFGVEKSAKGVVDLYYWTYYPYNLGKRVKGLGVVGNHISDWEALMVRTIDGVAVSVDFLAHTGDFGEGTVRWEDIEKENGRPVAYSASGSHGLWSTPDRHVYASALKVFNLVDVTSRGARWDTSLRLLSVPYFEPPSLSSSAHRRTRQVYSGESSWLNWRTPWGDLADLDCWWRGIYPACQMVDGPQGPARESLQEPPRCIISLLPNISFPESSKKPDPEPRFSHYSFTLSSHLLLPAPTTFIGVRQLCRRNGWKGLPDRGGEEEEERKRRGEEVVWGWKEASKSEVEEGRFEIDILECRKGFHVASYAPALTYTAPPTTKTITRGGGAADECEDCTYLPRLRNVCGYSAEVGGGERGEGRVVDTRDVDMWGWQE